MTARTALGALVALVLATQPVSSGDNGGDDETAGPGVRTVRSGGSEVTDVVVPGRLLSWAVERQGGEDVSLLVLSGPAIEPEPPEASDEAESDVEAPRPLPPCPDDPVAGSRRPTMLFRIHGDGRSGLEVVRDDLDPDASRILVLPSARGPLRLVTSGPRVLAVHEGPEPTDRILLEAPSAGGWRSIEGEAALMSIADGQATIHRRSDEGRWLAAAATDLPVRARVRRDAMYVGTPGPVRVSEAPDGEPVWATPPEAVGKRRVRTTLLTLAADSDLTATECWARLPDAEDVLESRVVIVDGDAMLVTLTKEADRLGLFAEKRLRVHRLRRDRSRLGVEAVLATESRMNLWQDASFFVRDVDSDGREDLVLGYWKGLKDDRVVLDAYLRKEDGGFERKPRTTAFDVDDGDRGFVGYGGDVDGDGRPDLVVRADDGLLVYLGVASPDGADLVNEEPIRIPMGRVGGSGTEVVAELAADGSTRVGVVGARGTVTFRDLDGDGRDEILVGYRGSARTHGRLSVVRAIRPETSVRAPRQP